MSVRDVAGLQLVNHLSREVQQERARRENAEEVAQLARDENAALIQGNQQKDGLIRGLQGRVRVLTNENANLRGERGVLQDQINAAERQRLGRRQNIQNKQEEIAALEAELKALERTLNKKSETGDLLGKAIGTLWGGAFFGWFGAFIGHLGCSKIFKHDFNDLESKIQKPRRLEINRRIDRLRNELLQL